MNIIKSYVHGKYVIIFLCFFVISFAIRFFIKMYKDVRLDNPSKKIVTYMTRIKKGKKPLKKIKERINQIDETIQCLDERIKIIEKLCEETPEEEQERLSMSQISNNSHKSSHSNLGNSFVNLTDSSHKHEIIPASQESRSSFREDYIINRESINHSLSNMDMSESVMLEI